MKKITFTSLILLCSLFSVAQTRVLYFTDGATIGTDQLATALTNTGCIVTTATTDLDFQTQIATPSNFDLAVYFVQNSSSVNATAVALAGFVTLGKKGMYADWSGDVANGALMGVNFTGNTNETVVTITDPTLTSWITVNPFTITNTGWGTFSYGLLPLAGSTVAGTFTSGEAALVRSMSNNMFVFGYLGDVAATSEMYEVAINTMFPSAAGVSENAASTFNTSVFPNPASESFTLSIDNLTAKSVEITVTDIQGKVVYSIIENNVSAGFSKQINTTEIAKGLYYVNVKSSEGQKTSKLIVQ
jgi:hypothetical protein